MPLPNMRYNACKCLKSDNAIKMNIAIVKAFIAFKQFIIQHSNFNQQLQQLRKELMERIGEHNIQLNHIYDAIENLLEKELLDSENKKKWENRVRIGFKK
jgi:hypothetical protein